MAPEDKQMVVVVADMVVAAALVLEQVNNHLLETAVAVQSVLSGQDVLVNFLQLV